MQDLDSTPDSVKQSLHFQAALWMLLTHDTARCGGLGNTA